MRKERQGSLRIVILLVSAAAAIQILGSACTESDPVLGPKPSLGPESHGSGPCIQTCFREASEALAREQKRFGMAVALSGGDGEELRKELLLHKEIRAEIRAQLRACRHDCSGDKRAADS